MHDAQRGVTVDDATAASVTLLVAGGMPLAVRMAGPTLAASTGGSEILAATFDEAKAALRLTLVPGEPAPAETALAATVEALLGWRPRLHDVALLLDGVCAEPLLRRALASGLVTREAGRLFIAPENLMQRRGNWLAAPDVPCAPLEYRMSEGRRHPRRVPKPDGIVYARHIPWLDRSVIFRALTLADLSLFHRWMNDPRVAAVWKETGTPDEHRAYLANLLDDPHMFPLIGSFGDDPFGYFEVYWAKENRIAPFYDADDYDRGWHVAVGEEAFRGRRYLSAWLPSLMHYLFLDDPRTRRIVGEPASDHAQQIRNLETSGFAKLKTFDFPHKRATLVMLSRERFFGDRLWLPAVPPAGSSAS